MKCAVASVLQAVLEVISIAAIIPLLYEFFGESGKSRILFPAFDIVSHISWQIILTTVVSTFLVKNFFLHRLTSYQIKFINEISLKISEDLYHRFFLQSWIDHLSDNSNDVVRKIKTTPSDFANHILQGFLSLLTEILTCSCLLGIMIWVDYRIVLIASTLCIPFTFLYYLFRKHIQSKIDHSFRNLTPAGNILLTQGISAFGETLVYQKKNFFVARFMTLNRMINDHFTKLKLYATLPSRIFEVLGILCLAAVIVYAKMFDLERNQFFVLLALFITVLYRTVPSLSKILVTISQIQAYSYSVQELHESFKTDSPNQQDQSHQQENLVFSNKIQLNDVAFHYHSNTRIFKLINIHITINKGDFVILRGPSGAGKTTFIHLLAGLLTDYEGQILIDDKALDESTRIGWQKMIGFVPQATIVLQDTIANNVAFGEDLIDFERVALALQQACLFDFVHSLPEKFNTQVSESGLTLSGGQRQRLVLARALYRNPSVLILDEATSQLDDQNKYNILHTLKALSDNGTTIILSTHDTVAEKFANRKLVIENDTLMELNDC